jgi:hypothetical protein
MIIEHYTECPVSLLPKITSFYTFKCTTIETAAATLLTLHYTILSSGIVRVRTKGHGVYFFMYYLYLHSCPNYDLR